MTTSGHTRRKASGFTLIELIVTITIATILAVVAVPSFREQLVGSRLTAQANEIVGAVNFARSEAIKRNGSVTLCRASSSIATACVTSTGAWEHWIIRTASGTVARRGVVNTYGNSIVVRSTLTTDGAVFSSDGLARTGGALISARRISVCATNSVHGNTKRVELGAGSRLSTQTLTEVCL